MAMDKKKKVGVRMHPYMQTMVERRILQAAMHLRYCLPTQGFEICIFKIIIYGRHTLSGMSRRVEVSSWPKAMINIIGLNVLATAEAFNPTSDRASEVFACIVV